MTFTEQVEIADGSRFQMELRFFIEKNGLKTIVESGFGVSTLFILMAIDNAIEGNEDAKLYSIDKNPWYSHKIETDQNELILDKSINALLPLYEAIGQFDLFLHDSDHDILCQTYEYNTAWEFLKPGGYLFSDDCTWGNHGAWDKFVKEKGLPVIKLGDCYGIQKPLNYGFCPLSMAKEVHEFNLHLAQAAENRWIALGNTNSDVFKD